MGVLSPRPGLPAEEVRKILVSEKFKEGAMSSLRISYSRKDDWPIAITLTQGRASPGLKGMKKTL
jgi:hypothetical protein